MRAGLVVVDKPAGMTSHDVVARIRRLAGTRKVGHAGTLDPMATGVLLVGVNRATRLLGHLTLTREGVRRDGPARAGTTTDDAEGETLADRVGRARHRGRRPLGRRRLPRRHRAAAVGGLGDQGRRQARLRPGPGRRGRSSCRPGPVTVHELLVTDVRPRRRRAGRRPLGARAAAAPTSGRSPATSARPSASAGT